MHIRGLLIGVTHPYIEIYILIDVRLCLLKPSVNWEQVVDLWTCSISRFQSYNKFWFVQTSSKFIIAKPSIRKPDLYRSYCMISKLTWCFYKPKSPFIVTPFYKEHTLNFTTANSPAQYMLKCKKPIKTTEQKDCQYIPTLLSVNTAISIKVVPKTRRKGRI